jgi:polar amino acid transport system substrate-binding protein
MKMNVLALTSAALFLAFVDYSQAGGTPLDGNLPAYIREKGKVVVGVDCGAPPFTYKDPSGKIIGAEVDIARKIAELSFGPGSEPELTCVEPASRIPYLSTKKVDIVIAQLSITPDRLKVIGISKPYFASSVGFLVKKGNEFTKLSALEGKTVSTSLSAPYIQMFKDGCNVNWNALPLATTAQSITALETGRTDAYISDITRSYATYTNNPNIALSGPDLRAMTGQATGIGFRKDEAETGKWIDAAIDLMQASDFFWTDFQKWMDPGQLKQIEKLEAIPRPDFTPDYKKLFPSSYEPVKGCHVQ